MVAGLKTRGSFLMVKNKACKICKVIYETGDKCPKCGSKESSEGFKGRIVVLDSEKSEIASILKLLEPNFP